MNRLHLGQRPLTIEDLVAISKGEASLSTSLDPVLCERLLLGQRALEQRLVQGQPVYGVTTGVGDSCIHPIVGAAVAELPTNLVRFHGCGTGAPLAVEETRAVLVARLGSLATGYSAVRPVLLERLCQLLESGITPLIPSEGSVGASGDLTPLSYVAAVLFGERSVVYRGQVLPASQALTSAGIEPLGLRPKESLALMNGTSVMTGLGCLAFQRAARLARLCASLTALAVEVQFGHPEHFDDRLFCAKPHPGQRLVARWIRESLGGAADLRSAARIQDRYSLRCAPHVIGALVDSLPFARQLLETELNGANDNPLVDPETGDILHGGNFYGGHICLVMDLLKPAVANLGDLLERQLVALCHPSTSNGLPENLVAPEAGPAHHGFKAMQITASALVAEAAKATMPASVFSRSTENHNQDKVSMGTIAARDCLRVLELTETVAAIHLLSLCQAADLRHGQGHPLTAQPLHAEIRTLVSANRRDRAMDEDIVRVLTWLRSTPLELAGLAELGRERAGAA